MLFMSGKEAILRLGSVVAEKAVEFWSTQTDWGMTKVADRIGQKILSGDEPDRKGLRLIQLMPPSRRLNAEVIVGIYTFEQNVKRFEETVDRFCSPEVQERLLQRLRKKIAQKDLQI